MRVPQLAEGKAGGMGMMKLDVTEQESGMVVRPEGRIDTTNAADFGAALAEARAAHPNGGVELDFSAVEYISSAGLREVLKLQKGETEKVRVTHLSAETYEIFDVTGFSKIVDTFREPEEFPVDGLEEIGRGRNGVVYRVDGDTIIKVAGPQYSFDHVEDERRKSQAALVAGLPTAIPFKTVRVGESYGALYELVDAKSVRATATADQGRAYELGTKMGQLTREMSRTPADKSLAMDMRTRNIEDARATAKLFGQELADAVAQAYEALPERETYLHGDFHGANIMVQGDELVMIDMGELGFGHPLIDLASTCLSEYVPFMRDPKRGEKTQGVPAEVAAAIYKGTLDAFFGEQPAPMREGLEKLVLGYAFCRMAIVNTRFDLQLPPEVAAGLKQALLASLPLIQAAPQMFSQLEGAFE